MIDKYTNRVALKTILLAELLIENLDELKETSLFRQSTKGLVNKLERELTPLVKKHYDAIYSEDVLNSISVLDIVIEQIVHNTVVEVQELKPFNLFIVRGKDGRKTHIKTTLTPEEFEKQYGATVK